MSRERARLLVVEDEAAYRRLLRQILELEGFTVDLVAEGAEALGRLEQQRYDLVLLDIMLPGMDGLEVCRRLRAASAVPIIMVTALGGEERIVAGLQAGADDYVTKPFGIPELLARVEAGVRRGRLNVRPPAPPVRTGALAIDIEAGEASSAGRPLALTATERRLLAYLARHLGKVLTHNQLLEQGWGPGYANESAVLHVAISRLRNKIEPDPAHPRHLLTRVGVGYTLAALPPDPT